jgi:hypothetical protein
MTTYACISRLTCVQPIRAWRRVNCSSDAQTGGELVGMPVAPGVAKGHVSDACILRPVHPVRACHILARRSSAAPSLARGEQCTTRVTARAPAVAAPDSDNPLVATTAGAETRPVFATVEDAHEYYRSVRPWNRWNCWGGGARCRYVQRLQHATCDIDWDPPPLVYHRPAERLAGWASRLGWQAGLDDAPGPQPLVARTVLVIASIDHSGGDSW